MSTQTGEESEYAKKLRHIQATADPDGVFAAAKLELEKTIALHPNCSAYSVCAGKSTSVREFVADRFRAEGLCAQVRTEEHYFYDGESIYTDVVRVILVKK